MSEMTNKVTTKHEIRGEVQITKVYPELENLTVTPTKENQSFNHPDSYGYNNVTVKAIDCKTLSVVPKKEEQAFDGMYDKVNVKAIDCETLNVTPKQENQSFDGMYDKVNVEKVQGSTLNVTPKEEHQSFNGLYETVNVVPINTEEITIDPDFSTQNTFEVTATEGKYIKKATVNKDANLVPENILEGEVVCGVEGTGRNGIDTSDATATAEDIRTGKTAYSNGERLTGTLQATDNNAKIESCTYSLYANSIEYYISEIDFSGIALKSKLCESMFQSCFMLKKIKGLNTSGVTNMYNMFGSCYELTDIEVLDTSTLANTGMRNMFNGCTKLSNESLNNILQMCINAVKITTETYKTLSYIGLTSEQATKCQLLSNYQAFLDAGWTTGY